MNLLISDIAFYWLAMPGDALKADKDLQHMTIQNLRKQFYPIVNFAHFPTCMS